MTANDSFCQLLTVYDSLRQLPWLSSSQELRSACLESIENFCKQNGNGCHDVEDKDYDGGDSVTDITYCCCDSDLCNGLRYLLLINGNGAEAIYFSALTISLAITMSMAM